MRYCLGYARDSKDIKLEILVVLLEAHSGCSGFVFVVL